MTPSQEYRLPELHGQKVAYVVEGEKDADRLHALGLAGTTNAGGAGKWRPEYVEQLQGASVEHVVVLPDDDGPGRTHADDVARSCHAAGLKVKIVGLPDLPRKGDVSDWLDAGHSKAELDTLVKRAPLFAPPAAVASVSDHANASEPDVDDHGLVVVRLSDVSPEAVRFIWPQRIARKKLNLLVGDPGLGKTTIAFDIAARMSRAGDWPDGGRAPAGGTLILTAEDDLADTVRPRLDTLGADSTHIHAITAVRFGNAERQFSLAGDLPRLDALLTSSPDTRLVIIDPLSAYLGGATDSYKDADVRAILSPLATLASARDVAVLGIMHLGKGSQRPALYRVLGSIAFTAAARLVLAVVEHPDKDGRRVLAPVKANICAPADALAFHLSDGRLTWDGTVEGGVNLDDVLSGAPDQQERLDAEDWLRELLTEDDRMPATDVKRAATNAGIGWRSVEAAKARLRVRSQKIGAGASGCWVWRLPESSFLRPCGLAAFAEKSSTFSDSSNTANTAKAAEGGEGVNCSGPGFSTEGTDDAGLF